MDLRAQDSAVAVGAREDRRAPSVAEEDRRVLVRLPPDDLAHASLRFGLGRFNTEEEVDHVARVVVEKATRLREMSPAWTTPG